METIKPNSINEIMVKKAAWAGKCPKCDTIYSKCPECGYAFYCSSSCPENIKHEWQHETGE